MTSAHRFNLRNRTRGELSGADSDSWQSEKQDAPNALSAPFFRRYLALRTASLIGDSAWLFGLAWEAARLGGGSGLGGVLAVAGIPPLMLTLLGGSFSDRWGIQRTMIASDFVAAALTSATALIWILYGPALWLLFAASVVFGIAGAFYGPSSASFMRLLLSPKQLAQGASARQTAASIAGFLGIALGGAVIAHGSFATIAAIDAFTFLIVGIGLITIHTTRRSSVTEHSSVWGTVLEGLRHLWQTPVLRFSLVRAAMVNCLGLALINVGLVLRTQEQGWGPTKLALIEIAIAVGMIVAGTIASRRKPPVHLGLIVSSAFLAFSILLLLVMVTSSPWLAMGLAMLIGVVLIPATAFGDAIVQSHLPVDHLGTVNGAMITVSMAGVPLGNAALGYAGDVTSPGTATAAGATALVVVAAAFMAVKPLTTARVQDDDWE